MRTFLTIIAIVAALISIFSAALFFTNYHRAEITLADRTGVVILQSKSWVKRRIGTPSLYRYFLRDNQVTKGSFVAVDRGAPNTAVFFIDLLFNHGRKQYDDLLQEGYKGNLLIAVAPCHYQNLDPKFPNGLDCWADLHKKGRLVDVFDEFLTSYEPLLPRKGDRLCLYGTSRFALPSLHAASTLIGKFRQIAVILNAPVINPLSLREFSGQKRPYALNLNKLRNVSIIASSNKTDPRVDERNLFSMMAYLDNPSNQLFVSDAQGAHSNYFPPEMKAEIGKKCW